MEIKPAYLTCLLKNRYKLRRRYDLPCMEPSAESFGTNEAAVYHIDLRLIERDEFVSFERFREILLDTHALFLFFKELLIVENDIIHTAGLRDTIGIDNAAHDLICPDFMITRNTEKAGTG